ncbi:NAD(+)/NADH kinase [Peptostreptococcaceae bacterium oral taxon 113 str. W5053]|nr:NAD(+)/NADH kinase [Peptostreptococcaceae bacterium oral taxon 113 str. W5053]
MKQISVFSNRNQYSQKIKNTLADKLHQRGYSVLFSFHPNSELNICIGGDGSFIKAVHFSKFSQIPFIGINTGHLGFFQEINSDSLDSFLDAYQNRDYCIEDIPLIEATIITQRNTYTLYALNEFLLKGMWSHMIQFDVYIDGVFIENFGGDGMVLSSPAGSTGHNASIGGAILYPSLEILQLTPLAPIHSNTYHSLRNPLIIPQNSKVRLMPEPRYANHSILVVDGAEKKQKDLKYIDFFISNKKIHRLVFQKDWYWKNLRDKFL